MGKQKSQPSMFANDLQKSADLMNGSASTSSGMFKSNYHVTAPNTPGYYLKQPSFGDTFKAFFRTGSATAAAEEAAGLRAQRMANELVDIDEDARAIEQAERNRRLAMAKGIQMMSDMGLMRFFQ